MKWKTELEKEDGYISVEQDFKRNVITICILDEKNKSAQIELPGVEFFKLIAAFK